MQQVTIDQFLAVKAPFSDHAALSGVEDQPHEVHRALWNQSLTSAGRAASVSPGNRSLALPLAGVLQCSAELLMSEMILSPSSSGVLSSPALECKSSAEASQVGAVPCPGKTSW